jgi:hypothetical protein
MRIVVFYGIGEETELKTWKFHPSCAQNTLRIGDIWNGIGYFFPGRFLGGNSDLSHINITEELA